MLHNHIRKYGENLRILISVIIILSISLLNDKLINETKLCKPGLSARPYTIWESLLLRSQPMTCLAIFSLSSVLENMISNL
jgi:hypothetical protein